MEWAVEKALEASGFPGLNPPQQAAVDKGVLEKSMIVAAPTASGKTLIAEIAALDTIKKGGKVVYVVPLKALASEKHEEFREKYGPLGVKVGLSIGDLDSSEPWLASKDLIIATSEKLDSLMRHKVPWISQVGLVVADEIHLLNDPGRGPTLEVVLTRLMKEASPRILGLSATISNYMELAGWLGAESVFSEYRPVRLSRGIFFDGELSVEGQSRKLREGDPVEALVEEALSKGKQALAFISTRRGTEAAAERASSVVRERLTAQETMHLAVLSERVRKVLEHPTRQCERLALCLKGGTAFHHAGLTNKQRSLVEKAFRDGLVKSIFATPTLAAGMNLPAWMVIVRDLKRFTHMGMDFLPTLEIQQMLGRAGRPKYDTEGLGILIAKSSREAEHAWEEYINGETERIQSKLGVEPVLRMHVLSLIASELVSDMAGLMEFFSGTFLYSQYKDRAGLEAMLGNVVGMLKDFSFIEGSAASPDNPFRSASQLSEGESLSATRMGKRVSELYLDPITAHKILEGMGKASGEDLPILQLICNTIEMRPLLGIRKAEIEDIEEAIVKNELSFLERVPQEWHVDYEDFQRSVKTALLFMSWADENGEDRIMERFGTAPGELRVRLSNADWLLYATQELAHLSGRTGLVNPMRKLRLRLRHGVKAELLPLVKLKGIGRARARRLFNAGFRGPGELRRASGEELSRLVGPAVAESIRGQV